jgi:hypothetical protein
MVKTTGLIGRHAWGKPFQRDADQNSAGKKAIPGASRVAVLINTANPGSALPDISS